MLCVIIVSTPRESKLNNNLSQKDLQILRKKFEIDGFDIQTYANSTLQSHISAESFRIQKKKIGFLRFALLNEGIFKDFTIKLFGSIKQNEHNITFDTNTMAKTFQNIPANRLTSIIATPITFELYNQESLFASITADNANFTTEKNTIVFRDRVQFSSKTHRLLSKELHFNIHESSFQVSGQHELNGIQINTATNYYLSDMHPNDSLPVIDTSI